MPEGGPALSLQSQLLRVWQVAHELEDERTVLFDEQTEELLVLSELGAALWYLLEPGRNLGQIFALMTEELSSCPDPEEMLSQSVTLLDELLARGACRLIL